MGHVLMNLTLTIIDIIMGHTEKSRKKTFLNEIYFASENNIPFFPLTRHASCVYNSNMKMTKIHRKQIKEAFGPKYSNGNISILAKKLRSTVAVARKIVMGNCIVSARRAIIIESLTGIPAAILRPDIFRR